MNNKGMTLVELIITFALVMVIVVGLYNLILEVKFQLDEKQDSKDLTEFSSVINNQIHYWLLKDKKDISEVYIFSNYSTTNGCVYSKTTGCPNITSKGVSLCKGIDSNCVVYYYNSKFKIIAFNIGNGRDSTLGKSGILYGDYTAANDQTVFQPLPLDKKYIASQLNSDYGIKLQFDKGNLIMDYPLYLKDDTDHSYNYGFKIVTPIG